MVASVLWLVTIGFFLLGLAGIFVPGLPGTGLIFAGVLFYALATSFSTLMPATVAAVGFMALVGWVADPLGAALGARLGGGGRLTIGGMAVGTLLGLMAGGAPGLFVGMLVGALLGALREGQSAAGAGRAVLFSLLGVVSARLFQLVLAILMLLIFSASFLV
jgi:uncharacterized protein YqgC (DUF456 family)